MAVLEGAQRGAVFHVKAPEFELAIREKKLLNLNNHLSG